MTQFCMIDILRDTLMSSLMDMWRIWFLITSSISRLRFRNCFDRNNVLYWWAGRLNLDVLTFERRRTSWSHLFRDVLISQDHESQDCCTYHDAIGSCLAGSLPKRPSVYCIIYSTPVSKVTGWEDAFSKPPMKLDHLPQCYNEAVQNLYSNRVEQSSSEATEQSLHWSKHKEQCQWL